ncbi:MAG: DNA repair protein RecN [Gammaproteobacteria bacterium]
MSSLTIQDLAVVRHLDIEFDRGLTVLTGETGAGKSILIGALGLALGDRADSSMVRSGCEKASVTACVDISGLEDLRTLFEDNELDFQGECILRRVVNADGRSRAYCNATPIPVQLLKQIGEHLVDIHAQHAQQSLLRKVTQTHLLDGFGKLEEEVKQVAASAREYLALRAEQNTLLGGVDNVASRIDFLRYQLDEIEQFDITTDALKKLDLEHRRIANGAKMIDSCERALLAVAESPENARHLVAQAATTIKEISSFDSQLDSVVEALEQALINIEEASRELAHFQQALEVDPIRLEQLEQRMQGIQDLARKHQCKAEDLPDKHRQIATELDGLINREDRINQINQQLEAALETYKKRALKLSNRRAKAALALNKEVTERIRELGIPHGEFMVSIEHDATKQPSANGSDDIEFLVTANPDQDLKPIRKVASGGELSRISLAIQVATSRSSAIPTLVFDEVDTGIGGPTAAIVSRYLRMLAEQRQILSITHLAQVASAGDHHLFVGKHVAKGATETMLTLLNREQRVEEVARMLGGERVTDNSLAHARELLSA